MQLKGDELRARASALYAKHLEASQGPLAGAEEQAAALVERAVGDFAGREWRSSSSRSARRR